MNPDMLYMETYTRVLPMCLARSSSPEDAVREAHKLSVLAQQLVTTGSDISTETVSAAIAAPAKRGPGRPRKETVNE